MPWVRTRWSSPPLTCPPDWATASWCRWAASATVNHPQIISLRIPLCRPLFVFRRRPRLTSRPPPRFCFSPTISASRRQQDDTESPNRSSQSGRRLRGNWRFVCCDAAGVDTPLPQRSQGKNKINKKKKKIIT